MSRKTDSAFNRDLEKNQAQANAQRSMAERQHASNQQENLSGFGRNGHSSNSNTQPPTSQAYTPSVPVIAPAPVIIPAPVVVQKSSSVWPAAVAGFMLGGLWGHSHATERNQSQYDSFNNQGGNSGQTGPALQSGSGSSDGGAVADQQLSSNGNDNDGKPAAGVANRTTPLATAPAAPSEGIGWKMLRVALWSLVLGSIGWVGYKIWRVINPARRQEQTTHYSLGGN